MTVAKKRVGVLISGRGSNLVSLIEAARAPDFPAEIVLVLSNKADAGGLQRAVDAGIATRVISHKGLSRVALDEAMVAALNEAGVEIVCNAGFMRLHSPVFVRAWHGRQLNIHPSLLPSFRGLHPQQRAIDAGARIAGATVHFVSEEMDAGPIIAQGAVPVLPTDDEDALSARILAMEHRLYPLALRLVASGEARLEGDRVVFADGAPPPFLF
ncbi:phosphoribosylglycinamide formyltransferase [Rhodomicrobium vannielii ATCC 17100]|uniref:phosphoribosylglycinamide formyltransferase n=1 Tax=Rhodomicrobium vannielii TaxID=1069 RepID=UPI001917AC30|nr:phosphoribosylglycinamide formyltransferase [Rhodomicrobium vannielii]MBJ7534227.1 phosphoribosylglycinamide formyltransferase [Rhodomicrobium vannielii ATCC 17100]